MAPHTPTHQLPSFVLARANHVRLDPVTGSWYCIMCDAHTHQDWLFKPDTWSGIRFSVAMPNIGAPTMTRKRKWDYTTEHQEQITTNIREGRVWNWGIRYSFNFTPEQSAASRARRLGKGLGPRPHTWKTGPDPELKHLRRRWLRAKNQARFWGQVWRLSWEQYRDTWVGHIDQLGRTTESLNLVRRDTTCGWTLENVHLMNRLEAMHRKTKGKKRIRPAGLGGGLHQRWRKK